MVCRLIGLVVVAASLSAPAFAEANEDKDAPIVVQGLRLTQTEAEAGASVTVLTAEDFTERGLALAQDALATVAGVTVNSSGGFGGQASVRIRGALSEQTLVLIDGAPVNDAASPGGGFDFARLDIAAIDRIEVLRGPQSTLWGGDAIGGVVLITTRKPEPGLGGDGFFEAGSFGAVRAGAAIETGGPVATLRLHVSGAEADGISKADAANGATEKDGYSALTLAANGGLRLAPSTRLEASVLWTDAEADFDSFVFGAQGNVGDGAETTETEDLAANFALRAEHFGGQLRTHLQAGHSRIDRRNFTAGVAGFAAEGERTTLRYQGDWDLAPAAAVAFGAEHETAKANGADSGVTGLFGLIALSPDDALTVTAGLRRDDHDRFGGSTTGRLAIAYRPNDTLTLRAAWGQGFKPPTLFQSTFVCGFCGLTAPNTNLRPETSEAVEAGVDWRARDGRAELGLTVFHQESEDLIDFSFTAGYDNLAFVSSRGIELSAALEATDTLRVSGSYAFIEAENDAGIARPRTPRHTADVMLAYAPQGPLSAALMVRHNGEEPNGDGTTLPGWTRVDASARYALSERLELYGRIENLLDARYQQVLGYGAPGLSGSFGARVRY